VNDIIEVVVPGDGEPSIIIASVDPDVGSVGEVRVDIVDGEVVVTVERYDESWFEPVKLVVR
jgi:hypothetical protein